jgi:hypothetical protein
MSTSSYDTWSNAVSTTLIVGATVGGVLGLIFCIGFIVIVICIIKQCNKPRNAVTGGMVLPPYPSDPYNIPRYPSPYAPPYTASAPLYTAPESEFAKIPPI